jgi:hypothetical protein
MKFYFVFQNSQSDFIIITTRVGGKISTNNDGRLSKILTNTITNKCT